MNHQSFLFVAIVVPNFIAGVQPQSNEPLEVLTMLIFSVFHFSISDKKITVQHQGFILVGGSWFRFRVSKNIFYA